MTRRLGLLQVTVSGRLEGRGPDCRGGVSAVGEEFRDVHRRQRHRQET